MTRRVPEFAVVTGVVLGVSALVSGVVLGWGLYATVVVGAAVSYPFVAFGIVRDDDPAATLQPRWLLAAGAVVAVAGGLGALLGDPTPGGALVAVLVALVLGAPAAGYATRYGAGLNPLSPRTTVLVGAGVGVILVVAGLALDRAVVGSAAGAIAGFGAVLYGSARGVVLGPRTKRLAAAGGAVVGVGVVGVGIVVGGSPWQWLVSGIAVAAAPSLYAALTRETRGRGGRRQR